MRIQRVVRFLPALSLAGSFAAPGDVLATSHERMVVDQCFKVDAATRALALAPRGSTDCLQIKPTGELRPTGDPSRCVGLDPKSRAPVLVDGVSLECVKIDLASRVSVVKGGATACFGSDPSAGVITVRPAGSPECLEIDPKTNIVMGPNGCIGLDPKTSSFGPVPVASAGCLRVERTTGELIVPGAVALDPARDRWGVRASIRYTEWEVPKAGVGTLIFVGPGSEVDAIIRRQDARGISIDLSLLRTPFGAWEVEYFEGDATSRATEPVDGAQVGFVYHQPSPTGSLGLNTGRNGGDFKLDADVKFFYFGYRPPFALYSSESPDCKLDLRPELVFGHLRTDYNGWSQSIRVPGIFSETRQEIEENRFGIGLRGHYSRRFADNIIGRLVMNLDLLYRDADLDSWQRNVCAAPGCAPAATFDASITDSDSEFTWQAGLKAGIDYSFTRNSRLGLEVGYRYLADTAALQNPTRTINIDRPPHLTDASVNVWSVGVSYRYAF
jgi:hypothetical protein